MVCNCRRLPGAELFRAQCDQRGCTPKSNRIATCSSEHAVCPLLYGDGSQRRSADIRAQEPEVKGSRVTSCATICLLLSMCACVLLVRHIDKTRPQQQNEDALYINSPNLVRRASLGFNGLMACIYWTRVVRIFRASSLRARLHVQRTRSAARNHHHVGSATASALSVRC